VVVVSAMGKTTDDLIRLARDVTHEPEGREMDMLLTAGGRVSLAVLTVAGGGRGGAAVAVSGGQGGGLTHPPPRRAAGPGGRGGDRSREAIAEGKVAIVAGFQGVSTARDITTLGRGGSDTTAVALAAALGAEACEIYTDVEGVYTADPRIVPNARKQPVVSF